MSEELETPFIPERLFVPWPARRPAPFDGPLGAIRMKIVREIEIHQQLLQDGCEGTKDEAEKALVRLDRLRRLSACMESNLSGWLLEAIEPKLSAALENLVEDEFTDQIFHAESLWLRADLVR